MTTLSTQEKSAAFEKINQFYPLSEQSLQALDGFINLLLQYNKINNLIGKSTIDDIWNRHIVDSAQLFKYIDNQDLVVGDFGSGAGLPGMVLSIMGFKEVHLIEKSFRKCQFLEAAKKFSTGKIIIHQKNAAEIADIKFDLITSRAFAPMDRLLSIVKPFAKKDTIGIFLKGKNLRSELELAQKLHQFSNAIYPSITSSESSILLVKNFFH